MSLELKGAITGNVRKYVAKADKTNDGKTALVDVEIVLSEVDAETLGGKLFRSSCFSDFVGKSGAATVVKKKLGGELAIKAEHTVEIGGYSFSVKPKVLDLEVSKKERQVTLTLRLPVDGSKKKLRRQLDDGVGDDIELKFLGVTQTELPGTDEGDDVPVRGKRKAKKNEEAVPETAN